MTSDKSYNTEQRLNTLLAQLLGFPEAVLANLISGNFPDTWNSLGSPSAIGWTTDHGRWRVCADGDIEFDIHLSGTSGSGLPGTYTFANTLPAGQRPGINRHYPLTATGTISAGDNYPRLFVSTAGSVQIVVPAATAVGGMPKMTLG